MMAKNNRCLIISISSILDLSIFQFFAVEARVSMPVGESATDNEASAECWDAKLPLTATLQRPPASNICRLALTVGAELA